MCCLDLGIGWEHVVWCTFCFLHFFCAIYCRSTAPLMVHCERLNNVKEWSGQSTRVIFGKTNHTVSTFPWTSILLQILSGNTASLRKNGMLFKNYCNAFLQGMWNTAHKPSKSTCGCQNHWLHHVNSTEFWHSKFPKISVTPCRGQVFGRTIWVLEIFLKQTIGEQLRFCAECVCSKYTTHTVYVFEPM